MNARLAATFVEKRYDADVWLDVEPSRRKVLLRMKPFVLALGETPLGVPALFIGNTDHIALVGDNDSGKSRLAAAFAGSRNAKYITFRDSYGSYGDRNFFM